MEYYTLNSALQRDEVIEGFSSFIWTERYSAFGDFEIKIASTKETRALLKPGKRITRNGSDYVATIETISNDTDEAGVKTLTVTGRFLEALLLERAGMPALASLTTTPNWTLSGTPGGIIRAMFTQVCVAGGISSSDTIPFYVTGTLNPPGSIPEPSTVVTITFQPDYLYNSIKQLADIFALGFRLAKNGDAGQIYFEVYTGNDRTSDQLINSPVIFSVDMESIDQSSVLTSQADLKTVAYVFTQNGAGIVYAPGYDGTMTGSDRRVLFVDASDIDLPAGAGLTAAINQRGQDELAAHTKTYAFDGRIPEHQPYIYGVDYALGDIVEERNTDGYVNKVLVTEQIFVSDDQGERAYPTLIVLQTAAAGSWVTEPLGLHWADVDPLTTWSGF